MLEGLFLRKNLRRTEAITAGEKIVDFEAEAIEGGFPPNVVGNDKCQIADQMRSILP